MALGAIQRGEPRGVSLRQISAATLEQEGDDFEAASRCSHVQWRLRVEIGLGLRWVESQPVDERCDGGDVTAHTCDVEPRPIVASE